MELYIPFLPYSSFVSQVVIFCSILPPTGGERREPLSASTDVSLASEHFSCTTDTHVRCLAPEPLWRGAWSNLVTQFLSGRIRRKDKLKLSWWGIPGPISTCQAQPAFEALDLINLYWHSFCQGELEGGRNWIYDGDGFHGPWAPTKPKSVSRKLDWEGASGQGIKLSF